MIMCTKLRVNNVHVDESTDAGDYDVYDSGNDFSYVAVAERLLYLRQRIPS